MSVLEAVNHICTDAEGRAWIDDTNVKVIEVVRDWLAHGSSPEELCCQFPHLTLAQIHAALAYYYDHQEHFDRVLAAELEDWDARTAHRQESPLRRKLRVRGLLR